jgi:hypothetical protein
MIEGERICAALLAAPLSALIHRTLLLKIRVMCFPFRPAVCECVYVKECVGWPLVVSRSCVCRAHLLLIHVVFLPSPQPHTVTHRSMTHIREDMSALIRSPR